MNDLRPYQLYCRVRNHKLKLKLAPSLSTSKNLERERERERMSGKGNVVCVTGASGYIASWLVKLLLRRGYTVRATVRNLHDPKKTEHLLSLDGAKERLHLFKADLLEENSFDSVIDGCDGVFHVASAVYFNAADPQLWYMLSKTLAEEAAWKFTKENKIDMVTIHPGLVIGPLLQPILNASVEVMLSLIQGVQTMPTEIYRWVDVRDVANAHVQAFEIPSASGRYCLVGKVSHCYEALKILRKFYPNLPLPEKCADDKSLVPTYTVSKEKAKSLGIDFIPLEVSLKDTIESLKERNLISF
ncbi:phenylacetaldehyde reductase-like isoform X3 [Malania oleifera]|uniref:phenylacetaldehyde reductase-like isoform X3 n=1 Tax=Malania oleifera TaxID=397392 RepID=UPI0025AE53B0|nr:phenylacetaldehyde reductase-like isoform X3 [Malania oleifera]